MQSRAIPGGIRRKGVHRLIVKVSLITLTSTSTMPECAGNVLDLRKEYKRLSRREQKRKRVTVLGAQLPEELFERILKYMDKTLKIPKRRAGPQVSLVEQHLLDIRRMQKQAEGVNSSLTQVLDLKQKHANAIEARFARDQAENTARQGQAIMVFTIVT